MQKRCGGLPQRKREPGSALSSPVEHRRREIPLLEPMARRQARHLSFGRTRPLIGCGSSSLTEDATPTSWLSTPPVEPDCPPVAPDSHRLGGHYPVAAFKPPNQWEVGSNGWKPSNSGVSGRVREMGRGAGGRGVMDVVDGGPGMGAGCPVTPCHLG